MDCFVASLLAMTTLNHEVQDLILGPALAGVSKDGAHELTNILHRVMADRLDAVAIGIPEECGII